MRYNKELRIILKETKIDDQNLSLSAADQCTEFSKQFKKSLQNKDAEKFYCFYYINIILISNKYLPQLSEDIATFIISKVTGRLLLKLKIGKENLPDLVKTDTKQELKEKEIHGLCYITGYISHTPFTTMKNSPK